MPTLALALSQATFTGKVGGAMASREGMWGGGGSGWPCAAHLAWAGRHGGILQRRPERLCPLAPSHLNPHPVSGASFRLMAPPDAP